MGSDVNGSKSHVSSCDSEDCVRLNCAITILSTIQDYTGSSLAVRVIASSRWIKLYEGGLSPHQESFISLQGGEMIAFYISTCTLLYMKVHRIHARAIIERERCQTEHFELLGVWYVAPALDKPVHKMAAFIIHKDIYYCLFSCFYHPFVH